MKKLLLNISVNGNIIHTREITAAEALKEFERGADTAPTAPAKRAKRSGRQAGKPNRCRICGKVGRTALSCKADKKHPRQKDNDGRLLTTEPSEERSEWQPLSSLNRTVTV